MTPPSYKPAAKVPFILHIPTGTSRLDTPSKCKTCAYHCAPTPEEDEMALLYYYEKPVPHPCHERKNGWVCKGALDTFQRLGLEVKL